MAEPCSVQAEGICPLPFTVLRAAFAALCCLSPGHGSPEGEALCSLGSLHSGVAGHCYWGSGPRVVLDRFHRGGPFLLAGQVPEGGFL